MTRLTYILDGLRELRANNWQPTGSWITLSAYDAEGRGVSITTNGGGEGEFSENYMAQYLGTCKFSICGWSDQRARAELRRRYEEMMENRRLNAELAQFERDITAECGPVEED